MQMFDVNKNCERKLKSKQRVIKIPIIQEASRISLETSKFHDPRYTELNC